MFFTPFARIIACNLLQRYCALTLRIFVNAVFCVFCFSIELAD